jgi:hypothetical protein
MTTSKRKKMLTILLLCYFIFVAIIYFAAGGFYFSRNLKKDQEYGKRLTNEFVSVNSNQVHKGIYAGIQVYSGQKHYHLQFPGLLNGPDRNLDIFYSLNEEGNPFVIESNEKLTGSAAYLILNPFGYYSGNNVSYDKVFGQDNVSYDKVFGQDTLQNPAEFLNTMNEKVAGAPDTLFVTALTVMENDIQVQMMMWTKDNDSTYRAKKFNDLRYAWSNTGNCKIGEVKRGSSGNGLKKFGAGVLDIISAPIQGIIVLVYFGMVLLAGGPVK